MCGTAPTDETGRAAGARGSSALPLPSDTDGLQTRAENGQAQSAGLGRPE